MTWKTIQTSGWADIGLFVGFALAGTAALYFGGGGPNAGIVHAVVALVMLGYFVVAGFAPRFRLRRDQAGDNAYYLGLLFTLISMSLVLARVTQGESIVERLLAAFGVALTSTILGVALRIVLHQMRVDPIDVEETTRQELLDASNRLKASLENSSREFARFPLELHTATQDAVREVFQGWTKLIKESVESANASLAGEMNALAAIAATLRQHQQDAERDLQRLGREVVAVGGALEEAVSRIRSIEAPPTHLASVLDRTTRSVASATAELELAHQEMTKSIKSCTEVLSASREIAAGVAHVLQEASDRERDTGRAYGEASIKMVESSRALALELGSAVESIAQLRRLASDSAAEQQKLKTAADTTIAGLDEAVRNLSSALRALDS
jgi:hypothetical protein